MKHSSARTSAVHHFDTELNAVFRAPTTRVRLRPIDTIGIEIDLIAMRHSV
jgi:hypothetical protein